MKELYIKFKNSNFLKILKDILFEISAVRDRRNDAFVLLSRPGLAAYILYRNCGLSYFSSLR